MVIVDRRVREKFYKGEIPDRLLHGKAFVRKKTMAEANNKEVRSSENNNMMEDQSSEPEFSVNSFQQLKRFLMLGVEHNHHDQTKCIDVLKSNISNLEDLVRKDSRIVEVMEVLVNYREDGVCEKMNCILLCLAICAVNDETKKVARENICKICKVPTQFFMFLELCYLFEQGEQVDYVSLLKTLGYSFRNGEEEGTVGRTETKSKKKKNKKKKKKAEAMDEEEVVDVEGDGCEIGKRGSSVNNDSTVAESTMNDVDSTTNGADSTMKDSEENRVKEGSSHKRNIGNGDSECSAAKKPLMDKVTSGVRDIDINNDSVAESLPVDQSVFSSPVNNSKAEKQNNYGAKRKKFLSKYKKFIEAWYTDPEKSSLCLLYLMTKYKSRYNWDHSYVLRLVHIKIPDSDREKREKDIVISYCLKGYKAVKESLSDKIQLGEEDRVIMEQTKSRMKAYIEALEELKQLNKVNEENEEKVVKIIDTRRRSVNSLADVTYAMPNRNIGPMADDNETPVLLTRLHITFEHVHTTFFNSKKVWQALLKDLPTTCLLSNVVRMWKLGLFETEDNVLLFEDSLKLIKLQNAKLRIHPYKFLSALWMFEKEQHTRQNKSNESEYGAMGSKISEILLNAYYRSFRVGKDTPMYNKNIVVSIDASHAMLKKGFLLHQYLSPTMAAVAMTCALQRERKSWHYKVFVGDSNGHLTSSSLIENMRKVSKKNPVENSPSFAIEKAIQKKKNVDAFIVYTKSLSNSVYSAFKRYKEMIGRNDTTKLVVCSMAADSGMIADPKDSTVYSVCSGNANFANEIYNFLQQ